MSGCCGDDVNPWFNRLAITAVVLGVALRLAAPLYGQVGSDGGNYAAIGKSLATHGTLTLPWGDVWGDGGTSAPSHHFPPLYPAWDALFYKLLGFGALQTQVAGIVGGLLAATVAFFATRRIAPGWQTWVTALVLWSPRLAWSASTGFSENLILALFVGTLWAIWESLENPKWILLAGFLAGLVYLSKSTLGPFFIVVVAGGIWWRVKNHGWKGLIDPYYFVAGSIFAVMAGAWAYRNFSLFGSWEASNFNQAAESFALSYPSLLAVSFFTKAAIFAGLLAFYTFTFWPWLGKAWRNKGGEGEALLWASVTLVAVVGAFIAAIYGVFVFDRISTWWLDAERYLIIGYVALLWIFLREARQTNRSHARVASAVALSAAVCCLLLFNGSGTYAEADATSRVPAGASVGFFGGTSLYASYAYLPTGVDYYRCAPTPQDFCPGHQPGYILVVGRATAPPGFHEVAKGQGWNALESTTTAVLYERGQNAD